MATAAAATKWTWVTILLIWALPLTTGHPQCLDFRAPFKPKSDLAFCVQYSDIGCCGQSNDADLAKEYDYIKSKSSDDDWERCQGYVKELLCQKCSPYAAHIYDAEGNAKARTFPGLCTDYCHAFYDQCRSMVWFLDNKLARKQAIFASKTRFCDVVANPDVDYCYPSLLSNPLLNRNLTRRQTVPATDGCLCLEKIKDNIANPLYARPAGDGSGRLFVMQQRGIVNIYNTRTKVWNRQPFLDLEDEVTVGQFAGDERGLLGMAFHPNYASNGRFFVFYVKRRESGDEPPDGIQGNFLVKTRVSEMRVCDSNPDRANKSTEKVVFDLLQPYDNHNGGELFFGFDGYLYIFFGDGGSAGDPIGAGQDKSLYYGKALRVDVDSDPSQPYTIPADNPFVGETGSLPEIYAYGLRNTWRCGLDKGDRDTSEGRGRILCGDVGQNAAEEVDLLKMGLNYGWRAREGFDCYDDDLCGNIGPEELPVHAYSHTVGKSVTGGVFYRGCESPALNGQYIYGDYVSSRLFSLTEEEDGSWTNRDVSLCGSSMCDGGLVGTLSDYILSFGEDEDGEIYVLTSPSSRSSQCDGSVFKIVDPMTRNDPSSCNEDLTRDGRVPIPNRKKFNLESRQTAQILIKVRKRKRLKRKQRNKSKTCGRRKRRRQRRRKLRRQRQRGGKKKPRTRKRKLRRQKNRKWKC